LLRQDVGCIIYPKYFCRGLLTIGRSVCHRITNALSDEKKLVKEALSCDNSEGTGNGSAGSERLCVSDSFIIVENDGNDVSGNDDGKASVIAGSICLYPAVARNRS
jgi:hypothetical protein